MMGIGERPPVTQYFIHKIFRIKNEKSPLKLKFKFVLKFDSLAPSYVVHDLNKDPSLPFPEDTFDAVICAVSIDYMKRPREVLAEVCS